MLTYSSRDILKGLAHLTNHETPNKSSIRQLKLTFITAQGIFKLLENSHPLGFKKSMYVSEFFRSFYIR